MATITPTRPPVFNLPNQLTFARLGLAIVLFMLIAAGYWLTCIVVFALASLTDYLDGYFARRQGLSSTLGRNLDPLVDKVLISGAYIFLLPYGMTGDPSDHWLLPWMVTVIVARELVITGLRSFVEHRGGEFGADWLGKLKMGLQCGALFAVFTYLWIRETEASASVISAFGIIRDGCIWSMLAATALSGMQYLWKAASLLKVDPTL